MLRANEMFCTIPSFWEKHVLRLRVLRCLGGCPALVGLFYGNSFTAMGKCVFSDLWPQKPLHKEWLRKIKGDKQKARCIMCMKDADVSSMRELALTSHLKGKQHQTLTSQKRSLASVSGFLAFLLSNLQLQVMMP